MCCLEVNMVRKIFGMKKLFMLFLLASSFSAYADDMPVKENAASIRVDRLQSTDCES